jgi:NADH dehydrogenase FAD-containing subunit
MLPEVISGTIGLTDVVSPIRRLLRLSDVHVRPIESVDLDQRVVTTSPGFRPLPHRIAYHHPVIALATVTDVRGLDPAELRVVLLHSGERILPGMDTSLALFAQRLLRDRGVEVRLGARLGAATGVEATLQDGERIPARTLVSTVPSSPHPLVESVVARLGPGQCFGEMALIREATRSATVRCTETVDVLCLPKQESAMLAAHLPDLRRSFERMSEERAAALRRTDP